jgi:arsenate reductase
LGRRAFAEFLGTGLLVAVVVGSGIAAQRLSAHDVGLQLLENSTATVFGLAVLILMLGPVSGAHSNPVVSLADWFLGHRTGMGLRLPEVGAYTLGQCAGAIGGAVLANAMFDVRAGIATTHRASGGHLIGEVVATAGLLILIFALARTHRGVLSAPAVGAYIGAAYWFTSSTSFSPARHPSRTLPSRSGGSSPIPSPVPRRPPRRRSSSCSSWALLSASAAYLCCIPTPARAPTRSSCRTRAASLTEPASPPRPVKGSHRMSDKPSVLFVCVHNAGRSQMAQGWLRHLAGDRVEVRSAGSAPGSAINAVAVQAMAEVGIDITAEHPKILTVDAVRESDVVITMGCGDTCPIFPGKRYEDWELTDPAGQGIGVVRQVRDEIRARIETLLDELLPAQATT